MSDNRTPLEIIIKLRLGKLNRDADAVLIMIQDQARAFTRRAEDVRDAIIEANKTFEFRDEMTELQQMIEKLEAMKTATNKGE